MMHLLRRSIWCSDQHNFYRQQNVTKTAVKTGTYKKGKSSSASILEAATKLLIDAGYHNFSLRKVAETAGISLGNLQYYFPTKEKLVEALLDRTIQVYLDSFEEIRHHGDPKQQLIDMIEHVVYDLNTEKTTIFFPELWSLSNHEDNVARFMDQMYGRYREYLSDIIKEINPQLTSPQVKRLALFVSCSLEGHTMFVGYRKPWNKETKNIIKMATQSFLWIIESGDIPK